MSSPSLSNEPKQEIIIVRRKKNGGDGHHGGAWKIAFADFMTAMMALFLVLWLVNAANEETKKAVASYFNPVKLVDRHQSERGLEPADGPSKKEVEESQPGEVDIEDPDEEPDNDTEASFRENPQQFLDQIAFQAETEAELERAMRDTNGKANDLRDPFTNTLLSGQQSNQNAAAVPSEEEPIWPESSAAVIDPDGPSLKNSDGSSEEGDATGDALARLVEKNQLPKTPEEQAVEKLRDDIAKGELGLQEAAALNVRVTDEGPMISILDTPEFPLFRSGSPVPEGRLVLLLQALGEKLKEQTGKIEIRGHTDSTPFRRTGYDNWNLSTDRAHSTRLMLLRSGLEEERIGSVAGFAASRPLDGRQPSDPLNRRIEILLRPA
ncbi:MAG: OmpA family protein [Ahrensia sp.]|nr:OmpA family protein [Ahrensia sp.]